MAPELLFTLICDDVRIEDSKKLIIVGLYSYVIGFMKPLEHKADQPLLFVLPQLFFVRRWLVDSPGIRVKTELIEPDGNSRALGEKNLEGHGPDEYLQEIIKVVGIVLKEGPYVLRTTVHTEPPQQYEEKFKVAVK